MKVAAIQMASCTRLADNLRALHSDLLSAVDGEFDLILANPPYLIDADQRAYRHGGGPLGAGLSLAILDAALQRLAPGGTLLLYTGVAMLDNQDPFLAEVRRRLQGGAFSWTYREVDPDVFGEELLGGAYVKCDRIAAVVLRGRDDELRCIETRPRQGDPQPTLLAGAAQGASALDSLDAALRACRDVPR